MALDPDYSIRTVIEDAALFAIGGDCRTANRLLGDLERDQLSGLSVPDGVESDNLTDAAVSLRMYVRLARKDLEAGDAEGALVSLQKASSLFAERG